jgi:hypothetical protein
MEGVAADQQQLASIDHGCRLAEYFWSSVGPVSAVAGR